MIERSRSTASRPAEVEAACRRFDIPGEFVEVEPYVVGHINDTFKLTYAETGRQRHYILQRINRRIFREPEAQMANIERVLTHLGTKEKDPRRVGRLVRAKDGKAFWFDREGTGEYWRAYDFIEGSMSLDIVETPEQAHEAARVFGRFQSLLADLPGPRLSETILGFHDTPARLEAFEGAVSSDSHGRVREVGPEIEWARGQRAAAGVLMSLQKSGDIPERIVHNDTKVNNVLFDKKTGEGLCVVDLDTVMPGLSLYDFGDLVRSASISVREDSSDVSQVAVRLPIFEALVRGYLESAGELLNAAEREHLAFSGRLIAFELGLRFLTDYLTGDAYFRTARPGQNLDRCRLQFQLAKSLTASEGEMKAIVSRLSA